VISTCVGPSNAGMLSLNNRLFAMARQGRRQPSALVAIVVTVVVLVVGIIVGQIAMRAAAGALFSNVEPGRPIVDGAQELLDFSLHFLPIFFCLWAWLAFWAQRPFATLGFERPRAATRFLAGALIGAMMMSVVASVLMVLPQTSLVHGELWTLGGEAVAGSTLALVGTIIQSSGEEVLFRGWLLPALGARYGPWPGVIGSSLLFGVAHVLNPNVTMLGLINLSLFGMFLAFYALATQSLWGACAWHALWNWTDAAVFGFRDSGGPLHSALLVSVNTSGPDLLTGGGFGPDGGLVETIVLSVGIAIVMVRLRVDAVNRHNNDVSSRSD